MITTGPKDLVGSTADDSWCYLSLMFSIGTQQRAITDKINNARDTSADSVDLFYCRSFEKLRFAMSNRQAMNNIGFGFA